MENEAKSLNFFWRKHALQRMFERGITRDEVVSAIYQNEIIEHYSSDFPYPSNLYFGKIDGKVVHVVASVVDGDCYIITTYVPDEKSFENDMKTRRIK